MQLTIKQFILVFAFGILSQNLFSQQNPEESAKKLIEQKDLDGDGTLCFMECPSDLSYDFKKIDTNNDKFLSTEEIAAHFKLKADTK